MLFGFPLILIVSTYLNLLFDIYLYFREAYMHSVLMWPLGDFIKPSGKL